MSAQIELNPSPATIPESVAAGYLGISHKTLIRSRVSGVGPCFVRLSANRLAYRKEDLDSWIAARVVDPAGELRRAA